MEIKFENLDYSLKFRVVKRLLELKVRWSTAVSCVYDEFYFILTDSGVFSFPDFSIASKGYECVVQRGSVVLCGRKGMKWSAFHC